MAGNITKRGRDCWLVQVFLGRDPVTGKQLRHRKVIHGRKEDAQRYLTGFLRDRDLGRYSEPSKLTLTAYLERWLETAAHDLAPKTLHEYRASLERYVQPVLGAVRLDRLAPLQIQELYTDLSNRGLSPATIRFIHNSLSAALRQAVEWKMIPENPAARTKRPTVRRKPKRVLTAEEVGRFVSAARSLAYPWAALLELAAATGMRPEEYLGLRWEDVDWDAGTVRVRQVLVMLPRSRKKGARAAGEEQAPNWRLGDPKTPKSRRTIMVSSEALQRLRVHRTAQLEQRLRAGALWEDHGLVFTTRTGTPLNRNNLGKRQFVQALRLAELPEDLTLYSLRHTQVTMLLRAGVNPKVVSERVGHTSVAFTLDVYGQFLPEDQRQASELFSQVVYGSLPGVGTPEVHQGLSVAALGTSP